MALRAAPSTPLTRSMCLGGAAAVPSRTAVMGKPARFAASSSGLAMVADEQTKVGEAPYSRQMRTRRRKTQAMCEPMTPR
ncbi:hypothetical protein DSECCO2_627770 [anaerobic digester metagenome]